MKKRTWTQEAICKSAKAQFLEHGFEQASLNQIIKDTGFTKGAFYGYYSSKEELFEDLVAETVKDIVEILNTGTDAWKQYDESERMYRMTEEFFTLLPRLIDYIVEHHDEVVLLLGCSHGTRYENFFASLQTRSETHGNNNMKGHYGEHLIHPEIYHVMLSGYYYTLKEIFIRDLTKEEMMAAVTDVQVMYQSGILALLEQKAKEQGKQ